MLNGGKLPPWPNIAMPRGRKCLEAPANIAYTKMTEVDGGCASGSATTVFPFNP